MTTLAGLDYEQVGEGPPLLLVHAGIADRRMWDEQVPALAERFTVIRPDLRGFGRTPPPSGPFTLWEDLLGLIDALGWERVSAVGASVGAGAVLDLALQAPSRVDTLVLVGPAISGREGTDPAREALYLAAEAAFERGDLEEVAEVEIDAWVVGVGRPATAVDERLRARVRDMLLPTYEHTEQTGELEVEADQPAAGRLAELRAPTLVVVGEHDRPGSLENARLLETTAADARVVTIPGTGHLPNLEQPARFNQLLLDFLAPAGVERPS